MRRRNGTICIKSRQLTISTDSGDRYLKEIENGWETTPRVRGCMLTYTGLAVTDFSRRGLPGPTYRLSTIPSRR